MIDKKIETFVKCLSKLPNTRNLEDITCIKGFLKNIEALGIYKDLTISEYSRIARYENYQPNSVLYRRGDICTSWYIVLSGCVLVDKNMYLPRKCFGRRNGGNLYRFEECMILEETELIVIDYAMDRQISILTKKPNLSSTREFNQTSPETNPNTFFGPYSNPAGNMNNNTNNLLVTNNKRSSHASDTSSGYSGCCDAMHSSSVASETDDEDDEDDDDEEEEEFDDIEDDVEIDGDKHLDKSKSDHQCKSNSTSCNSNNNRNHTNTTSGNNNNSNSSGNDLFFESAVKIPEDRTDIDIENLVAGVRNYAAFSNLTERSRYELCRVMRVAIVNTDSDSSDCGRLLLEDGQVLDSWNVVLEGYAELRDNTNCVVREYGPGDSFGVKRAGSMDTPQYQQGDIWTVRSHCVFFCATNQDYLEIIQHNNDTIIPETVDDGRQVLVYEQRTGNSKVIVKGTPDKLLYSLLFDRYKSDPMYTENFLIMYRVFVNSPSVLARKLLDWYKYYSDDRKVREEIRRCLVMWANNHFQDLDDCSCQMTEYLEQFEEIFNMPCFDRERYQFHHACSSNSKPRIVTVQCDKTINNNPIQLTGMFKGYGLFIKDIDRSIVNGGWNLRRGDQILSSSVFHIDTLGSLDKVVNELNSKLEYSVNLVVKYNPLDFQDWLDHHLESNTNSESSKSEELAMLARSLKFCHLHYERYTSSTISSSRVIRRLSFSKNWAVNSTLHGLSDHVRSTLGTTVTPMVLPGTKDFSQPEARVPQLPVIGNQQGCVKMPKRSIGSCSSPITNPDYPDNKKDGKNARSAHTSPHRLGGRQQNKPKQHPIQKRLEQKPKPLNSRSSSNPNLKGEDEKKSISTISTPHSATATYSSRSYSCTNSSSNHVYNTVIKVFRPNTTDFKLISISSNTTVDKAMPVILKEFAINLSDKDKYYLYKVSANVGADNKPVLKASRIAPTMQNLAGQLALNQRYYLKHANSDTQLISAEQLEALLNESKISIHNLSAKEIATRLTYVDYSLFRAIDSAEYVNNIFELPLASENSDPINGFSTGSANFEKFSSLINEESFWPTTEICNEPNVTKRAELIKKFIKVAKFCKKLKNYNSLMCIVTGLTLTPVERLKLSWEKVPNKYRKMYNDLSYLVDMSFNFRRIRQLQSAEITEPPLIPCFAIHSKDLASIHINNKTLTKDGLVNFEKLRMIATEVRKLTEMCSSDYNLNAILCTLRSKTSLNPIATIGFFNFASTNNNNTTNNTTNNGTLDESKSVSSNDSSSVTGGIGGINKKFRSNSVDHPISSDFSNNTLKKRNFKRKSITLPDNPVKTPRKTYEEWLCTLKFNTYWSGITIIQDTKPLHEKSEALEPPLNFNLHSNLSLTSGSNSVVSVATDSSGVSSSKSSSTSVTPSPKSSVTINLTNKSPTEPLPALAPKVPEKLKPANPGPVLRNALDSYQTNVPNKPNKKSRPTSIFSYQTAEDSDKLKELIQSTRKIPKKQIHNTVTTTTTINNSSSSSNSNNNNHHNVVISNVTNSMGGRAHSTWDNDDRLLRNYLPAYNSNRRVMQETNYSQYRQQSVIIPGGASLNLQYNQYSSSCMRPEVSNYHNYMQSISPQSSSSGGSNVRMSINDPQQRYPTNLDASLYISNSHFNNAHDMDALNMAIRNSHINRRNSGRPEPPAYEAVQRQRVISTNRTMNINGGGSSSSSSVSTTSLQSSGLHNNSPVVNGDYNPSRPPPVPPSYNEHMLMMATNITGSSFTGLSARNSQLPTPPAQCYGQPSQGYSRPQTNRNIPLPPPRQDTLHYKTQKIPPNNTDFQYHQQHQKVQPQPNYCHFIQCCHNNSQSRRADDVNDDIIHL